jgi:hypothetical protein
MVPSVARRLLLAAAILAVPAIAHAQEAVFTGTVADSTGGVLDDQHAGKQRAGRQADRRAVSHDEARVPLLF